jgi:hypothetical protein
MSILSNQSALLNGGGAVGNLNANGGSLTATTGGVANVGNMQFGSNGGSANVLNSPNKGLYAVQGGANSPSHLQKPFPSMSGGGRKRRKSSKTSRRSRKNRHSRSRKYGRKRGSKRVTRSRSRSRSRRGGRYTQYMSNVASSFGQTMPGFPLTSRMSALATPTPFRPYQNCPGGL